MKKLKYVAILLLILLIGCKAKENAITTIKEKNEFSWTVEEAPEWENLFLRNEGWFGGDGLFMVNLSGSEKYDSENPSIMMWFSDSMFGKIDGTLKPGARMTNNATATMRKSTPDSASTTFYADYSGDNRPKTLFIPENSNEEYYWLGDGFVNTKKNNDIYIFAYRMKTVAAAAFGFKNVGNDLLVIPKGVTAPYKETRQLKLPFFNSDPDSNINYPFGTAIFVNRKDAGIAKGDNYIYIYSSREPKKNIYVARVYPEDIELFDKWTFWNGEKFVKEQSSMKPIFPRGANEMSVTSLPDGRLIFIYQDALNGDVLYRLSETPVGPVSEPVAIYKSYQKTNNIPNLFTYNAKAHPVISPPGELIISIHVNSFKFLEDINKYPHLYAPCFIRMKYSLK